MSDTDPVKTAIELVKKLKHLSVDVEAEAHRHKSQRLIEISRDIDLAATDALNTLYGVKG